MSLMDKKDLERLLRIKGETCVSILIPTDRAGKDVLEEKSKLHLKSLWKDIESELHKKGVADHKIEKIKRPILELMDDHSFWRHQSDGLAIYAAEDFFEKYALPIHFEAHTYVANEFYIKPLVPMFSGDERFYILALQLAEVELYEATRYSIGKVEVEDLIPSRLEERVGFDYKEKHLNFRSQNSGGDKTVFHGHGGGEEERKEEINRYFRAIDKGLDSVSHNDNAPLVVATQDYLFPIYQKVNTYKHLFDEVVPGNPSDSDMFGLHEKALKLIDPVLRKTRLNKIEEYKNLSKTERTGTSITDILPAVQQGKVDTLFLENRSEIWGHYDKYKMETKIHDKQQVDSYSLMNWAAKEVLTQGGNVFLIPKEDMLSQDSQMNALYRYS